jgi:hypothetical protein
MNGTTFIGIMTFANFLLLLGLAYYILKGKQPVERYTHSEETKFAEFLQNKIEPEPVSTTTVDQFLASAPKSEETLDGRALAVKRLKMGEDPEEVAGDLGFSRSEIGILQAAARR